MVLNAADVAALTCASSIFTLPWLIPAHGSAFLSLVTWRQKSCDTGHLYLLSAVLPFSAINEDIILPYNTPNRPALQSTLDAAEVAIKAMLL